MRRTFARTGVILALLAAGCGGGGLPGPATGNAVPGAAGSGTPAPGRVSVATVGPAPVATARPTAGCPSVSGSAPPAGLAASFPVALAFAPDGRLFYAERGGTVRVWQGGAARVFAGVNTVTTEAGGGSSERGLLGLALSPNFGADHFVYAFYSLPDRAHQDVVRWYDCGGSGTSPTRIVELPSGGDCCHKGGRIAFGPDGKLYVTLGDEHSARAAQSVTDLRGKVLRYNPDGSIPADNPFGAGNPVWAYGLRNPFGIAFGPAGSLLITSNGPSGDAGSPATGFDLALTVSRGDHLQWPYCYGYSHPLAPSLSCGAGTATPGWSSEAGTVVPTGATYVDRAGPPAYAGHFVFCTYDQGMLVLTPGTPHASVVPGPAGCRLDVKEGPDHALYVSSATAITRVSG